MADAAPKSSATNLPADEAPARRRRIGVFGGTFDPIHIGHLILADEAHFQLDLDVIYLIPAADPPHKRNRRLTVIEHRLQMARLATINTGYLHVSRMDADRPGPHYTADMVRLLQLQTGNAADLFFLMGMDSLRDLPTWYEADWLVRNCTLVALTRHDVELDWSALEAALPGIRQQVVILDMPELEISSHLIQQRVREGRPFGNQLPPGIEEYIRLYGLYGAAP
ncbi:MAG: nicotinate-nucleotide adenylyltransferase, partial [Caldilineaceae bacterium]